MIQDDYNILNEILIGLKQELSDLNAEIHINLLHIREIDQQLIVLNSEESEDYKLFSPRSMTEQHKDKVETAVSQKEKFEKNNAELSSKKENLVNKIDQLEVIIEREKKSSDSFAEVDVQEEERRRIAGDLHDSSLQDLAYLMHKIELCRMYIDQDPEKAKSELKSISDNLREIVKDIRDTIFDLRPMNFADIGLKAAFERLLENIHAENKIEIISEIEEVSCENKMILFNLYRVVQEGFRNVIRHSGAEKVSFFCSARGNSYVIDLNDNGHGFDEKKQTKEDRNFGLSLMRERIAMINGVISISTTEGEGTKVHIEVPV